MIAAAGIDCNVFLNTRDRTTQLTHVAIATRVHKLRALEHEGLAVRIANAVGKMLNGGR